MTTTSTRFLILGLILSVVLLNAGRGLAIVNAQSTDNTSIEYIPAQIIEPFEEMLPGVYVAWDWWNDSGYYNSDDIDYPEPAGGQTDITLNWTDPWYGWYYVVQDIYNNTYYIEEEYEFHYVSEWAFTNLLVMILLDPDASYMAWLAQTMNQSDYASSRYDYAWNIFWWPEPEAFTGDEVLVYSQFYFSEYNETGNSSAEYTWFDDNMTEVDANEVIPYLSEDYYWASWMNESWEYDYDWAYSGYGYDINEMFLEGNTTQWMDHYHSGMSVFNDTNDNGIMDMVYEEVEYDWNEDNITDWVNYELNIDESELLYEFYSVDGSVGEVTTPYLNDNGEIEWGAEVVDIEGDLWDYAPVIYPCYDTCEPYYIVEEPEPEAIPVNVENLEMVYRFGVTDTAAVLKIDQHIGDFTDPETGEVSEELEGLSLAFNYMSWFSSYTMAAEIDEGVELVSTQPEAISDSDGMLTFFEMDDTRTTIEFGGTYVWGKDGGTYDVGTAVMPSYFYTTAIYGAAPSAELSYDVGIWGYQAYYYSSCYGNWDGYAITHDPIFSVFPMKAPGQVSGFIDTVLLSSIVLSGVGLVTLSIFCVRTNRVRKLE